MGLRMLDKITRIVDEEMASIGASRLEMPQLLSSALWHKTGRVHAMGSELYRFKDRRGAEMLLAPTHEEEVTKLIGSEVDSAKALPIRVYQVGRKFRDEPRPRAGLLRTKEFLMKDLYSFDKDLDAARATYAEVRSAYARIFDRLFDWRHLPPTPEVGRVWREAEADTGAMGGVFSHEFHVEDTLGEDTLLSCDACAYAANTECATSHAAPERIPSHAEDTHAVLYASAHDPTCLYAAVLPIWATINPVAVAREGWVPAPNDAQPTQLCIVHDCDVHVDDSTLRLCAQKAVAASDFAGDALEMHEPSRRASLRLAEAGDVCTACGDGRLAEHRAMEIGHTFLLGSRYSDALGYTVQSGGASSHRVPLQMGCYGIGITRILGALAQRAMHTFTMLHPMPAHSNKTRAGLVWPRGVAPVEALVLAASPNQPHQLAAGEKLCTLLAQGVHPTWRDAQADDLSYIQIPADELALDDRPDRKLGASLFDAELVGYPLVFLVGKHWEKTGEVEVRRAGYPVRYATFPGMSNEP